MCDLLGGEDRIDPNSSFWNDGFIVNFGTEENSGPDKKNVPVNLNNWHVDGDFFVGPCLRVCAVTDISQVHFLDSPEQALLVTPLFSDIASRGGGTMIAPDGIDIIAKYLHSHPEGVLATKLSFTPVTPEIDESFQHTSYTTSLAPNPEVVPGVWHHLERIHECNRFEEMTGEAGDVVLLHPLMMHSFSPNLTRAIRVITNPPVSLKEPFKFSSAGGHKLSLVERKTLAALGVDEMPEWKITGERRNTIPERVRIQEKLLEEEKNRLKMQAGKEAFVTAKLQTQMVAGEVPTTVF